MPDLPAGRTRLLQRLTDREDVAFHPGGALDHDEPHEEAHFHRPGEVLVPDEPGQIALFERLAHDLGIRHRRDVDDPEGPADRVADSVRTAPVRGTRSALAVARYFIRSRSPLESVLRRLERASHHNLQVTPNHVLFGSPLWGMAPDGDPRLPDGGTPPAPAGQGGGVRVAVVDTGIPRHAGGNALLEGVQTDEAEEEPWDYSGSDHVLTSPDGHGSFVAGVIRQVAAGAELRSFRVLDTDGLTDEWYLGHQLALVLEDGAQVINLSLGTSTRADRSLLGLGALAEAAARSVDAGGPIVVAAAGNHGDRRRFYPAAEPWAIGVGAVEPVVDGRAPVRASFSNFGQWVDTCAVGVDVLSSFEANPYRSNASPSRTVDFTGFALWNGTSFAAPRVSGRVAEILARGGAGDLAAVKEALAGRPDAVKVPGVGWFVS